ncbi:conserved virulence factor C family protein [Shimazuella sp. AN120528]|uniref:conserved virulence factor C family protein n=1 Tax=Shimazuella soli TaxID=1892854 RepID=UPI001F0D6E53|nr:conserved virulence factor C family protein [Shimazuella soli]MCH5584401.1 conserved virulence factor C family protein [Shimazuella soli]
MKIVSIEPTPSPNVMKCNLDQSLPTGTRHEYTKATKEYAPDYLQKILNIEGVTGVFQVLDFLSIERHPKADWEKLLSQVREIFGEEQAGKDSSLAAELDSFGEVQVLIQTLRGIPYQIKLVHHNTENRFALPDRFQQAVLQIQGVTSNVILERKWMDQGVRYGEPDEIGKQLTSEYEAMYPDERLKRLVKQALSPKTEPNLQEQKKSAGEVRATFQQDNWEIRYAALMLWEPAAEEIDILDTALDDPSAAIRRQAVVFLGYIGGKIVLPYLYRAMKDSSAIVRRTAGDTISDIGDPDAIEVMCESLKDKNKLVRWRAARFLYEVGDETAVPALQLAIDDPEFEVKMQAQIALQRITEGEEASGTVWQQMTQSYRSKED